MTLADVLARQGEISGRLDELAELDEVDDEQQTEWEALNVEFDELAATRSRLEKREEVRKAVESGRAYLESGDSGNMDHAPHDARRRVDTGDPYAFDPMRAQFADASELRGRALRAIEITSSAVLPDWGKQRATELVERYDDRAGTIAKLILATGSRHYGDAFVKYLRGHQHMWTPEEVAAVRAAASLTDAAGGFAVPFPIDPTLILTNTGSANPFRQISRVVPITTDSWQGISAGAVAASWDGEASAVSEDTPTWAQPQVPVHKAQAFVPYSIEIGQDYPGFLGDMRDAIVEGKDELEGAAFATGSGSSQPTGIVTALTGTGSVQASGTTDTFTVPDDLSATVENLRAKSRGRAVWVGNLATYNQVREDTATTDAVWATTAAGIPDQLYGRPAYESSDMDGTINAAADNYLLVFGDFSRYVIADRVGLTVELIPHIFADAAGSRPTGQRGVYAYWRVGGDSVDDGAFSMLNVT